MALVLSRTYTCTPITGHNVTVTYVIQTCLEARTEAPLPVKVSLFAEQLMVDVYVGSHLVIGNLRDVCIFLSNRPLMFTLGPQTFSPPLMGPHATFPIHIWMVDDQHPNTPTLFQLALNTGSTHKPRLSLNPFQSSFSQNYQLNTVYWNEKCCFE